MDQGLDGQRGRGAARGWAAAEAELAEAAAAEPAVAKVA